MANWQAARREPDRTGVVSPRVTCLKAAHCEITPTQGECRVAAAGRWRHTLAVIIVPLSNLNGARSINNASARNAPTSRQSAVSD